MNDIVLRPATAADGEAIARIYNHYVRETTVTFEEHEVSSAEMVGRWTRISSQSLPWLVAERAGAVVGYAYAGSWHGRSAYRFSVESTIYLAHDEVGRGLGKQLYEELLARLREKDLHVAIGVIALPNPASVALHERCGFVEVGHLREVGRKLGRWLDVGYWQTSLGMMEEAP